jgi:Ribonucleotide reductase, alpha subunit
MKYTKARYSATRERSIGIGAMGFHNLLMKNSIPFESQGAAELNEEIFQYIQSEAIEQIFNSW